MRNVRLSLMVALIVGVWGAGWVVAQDKPKDRPKDKPDKPKEELVTATVQVWAIRATKKNSDVDKELKELADKLKRDVSYTGFKLEKRTGGSASSDKAYAGELIGGYSVKVTPKRNDGKKVQLEILIQGPKTTKATVTLNAGEYLPLGGSAQPLEGGDALIVAVSAR